MMAFSRMFVIILCEVATAAQTAGILHESPILQRSSNHESPILQRNFSTESPTQKHTLQTDIGCPSSQIVSTEGVSTCKSNVNCVDGLLCCPTATGNVRVCRKSQADNAPTSVCRLQINPHGISCESGAGATHCVNGTCENTGDSGIDFSPSNSGSDVSEILKKMRDDVDELKRRFEALETRTDHLSGKR